MDIQNVVITEASGYFTPDKRDTVQGERELLQAGEDPTAANEAAKSRSGNSTPSTTRSPSWPAPRTVPRRHRRPSEAWELAVALQTSLYDIGAAIGYAGRLEGLA